MLCGDGSYVHEFNKFSSILNQKSHVRKWSVKKRKKWTWKWHRWHDVTIWFFLEKENQEKNHKKTPQSDPNQKMEWWRVETPRFLYNNLVQNVPYYNLPDPIYPPFNVDMFSFHVIDNADAFYNFFGDRVEDMFRRNKSGITTALVLPVILMYRKAAEEIMVSFKKESQDAGGDVVNFVRKERPEKRPSWIFLKNFQ